MQAFRTYEVVLQQMGNAPKLTKQDFVVPNPPEEKLSTVHWVRSSASSCPNILFASGWDGTVRFWNVLESPHQGCDTKPISVVRTSTERCPVFDVCSILSTSGIEVFYTSADSNITHAMISPDGTTQQRMIAQLPAIPANNTGSPMLRDLAQSCAFVEPMQTLFVGTWSGRLYGWDVRAGQSAPSIQLETPGSTPIQSMDLSASISANMSPYSHLGVILSPRAIHVIDLRARLLLTTPAALEPYHAAKHQLRSIVSLRDHTGFAAGSMDGRLLVQFYESSLYQRAGLQQPKSLGLKSYSFRAHRENGDGLDVFPVNAVATHPHTEALVSGGGNGSISFWNRFTKERISETQFPRYLPVTSLAFNSSGSMLAYGLSYDWSMGPQYFDPIRKPPAVIIKMITRELVHTGRS